jgi:hypothetical protein
LNYATREVREFAQEIVRSPEYRESIRRRAIAGTLGAMEQTLWHYAYGKPTERMEVAVQSGPDLSELSAQELCDQLVALVGEAQSAAREEEALMQELRGAAPHLLDGEIEACLPAPATAGQQHNQQISEVVELVRLERVTRAR